MRTFIRNGNYFTGISEYLLTENERQFLRLPATGDWLLRHYNRKDGTCRMQLVHRLGGRDRCYRREKYPERF